MRLMVIIGIFLLLLFPVSAEDEKLNCNLGFDGLCIELNIGVDTSDKLNWLKPHNYPNFLAQNDKLFIENIKAINLNKNKTLASIFTLNFIPLVKEEYKGTRYGSSNYGEYQIRIPPLKEKQSFKLIHVGNGVYKSYIDGIENKEYSFRHWRINLYKSNDWVIEKYIEGEGGYTLIINNDFFNDVFYVFSVGELNNIRNGIIMLIITVIIGMTTIVVGLYSIYKQKKGSEKSASILEGIKNEIIKSSEDRLKFEKIDHIKIQIGLLSSLLTELEMLSSKSNKIKIISDDYKIRGNLEWFKESVTKNETPLHDMWEINPSKYLSELDNEINGIKLEEIKKFIVFVNQKISLLNFYREGIIDETVNTSNQNLIDIIDEVINAITKAKEFVSNTMKDLQELVKK